MFHQFTRLSPHYALVTLYLHVFNNKANVLSESADRNRRPVAFATVWQLFLFTLKSTSGTCGMENISLDISILLKVAMILHASQINTVIFESILIKTFTNYLGCFFFM